MSFLLAIETSCDETAASVIQDGKAVLSNVISSQIEIHRKYGGIVPEVAARQHTELINPVIQEALEQAGIRFIDLAAVGVTYGPGLIGALMVGLSAAKALSLALRIPLMGVNHLEGHLYSCFLRSPTSSDKKILAQVAENAPAFPFLCLIVSGGHTSLVLAKDHGKYQTIGQTRDDACGEAFDKVARLLGLGYPGGPIIDRIAAQGNPDAVSFPPSMTDEKSGYDFSYSGLKTAVFYQLRQAPDAFSVADIAASFQKAAVELLVRKTFTAARDLDIHRIAMVGGVSANRTLRQMAQNKAEETKTQLFIPPPIFSTDNAAMIGLAAFEKWKQGHISPLTLQAVSSQAL